MPIDERQKRLLKGLAHHLRPVVIVGQAGLTEGVHAEIAAALEHHELIKVKVQAEERTERRQMIDAIAAASGSQLIQSIGHMAVFFRANPKKKSPLLASLGAPRPAQT